MNEATANLEWDHPHIGRLMEPVCKMHERGVLQALTTLGIGCTARKAGEQDLCLRCLAPGRPPRVLLRERFGRA